MVSVGHLAAFALAALILIAVPGPSVLFTVSRALTLGRRGALITVVGNASGQVCQITAVAVGVGAVVARSITIYTVIKLIGAAYLIYLGVQAFRHRHVLTTTLTAEAQQRRSTTRVFRDGFVVGVTNPKSIVFFVAVLPQFIDQSAGNTTAQLLVLGTVFLVIGMLSDSVWALAAGSVRLWLVRSPRRVAAIGGASGLTMVGIGLTFAVSGRDG